MAEGAVMGKIAFARPLESTRKFLADFSRTSHLSLIGERGLRVSMQPLPLLKDLWSLLRDRRLLHAEVLRQLTVDEWYHPSVAISEFADPQLLGAREIADQEAARINWPSGAGMSPEEYRSARARAESVQASADNLHQRVMENIQGQLVCGELIARGFREPVCHGAFYLPISKHEWRILKLEPPDRAAGGGVSYTGLTIGKADTRRFFPESGK